VCSVRHEYVNTEAFPVVQAQARGETDSIIDLSQHSYKQCLTYNRTHKDRHDQGEGFDLLEGMASSHSSRTPAPPSSTDARVEKRLTEVSGWMHAAQEAPCVHPMMQHRWFCPASASSALPVSGLVKRSYRCRMLRLHSNCGRKVLHSGCLSTQESWAMI
jgi:hypothetical protein